MSLMGYTEEDVIKMLAALAVAKAYIPLNTSNDAVIEGIQETYDFLDGLLIEGRL